MNSIFFFGLGYSARALADRLARTGWHIAGTSRTAEAAGKIRTLGYDGIVFDGTRPGEGVRERVAEATHVVVSISPASGADPVLAWHREDVLYARRAGWIGYLSTIGVYGDRSGDWVDETEPARPGSERTRRRIEAEDAWRRIGEETGRRVQIFRLGGIYGPGRSTIDDLLAGTQRRIVKPAQVFNRIHVEDIAQTLSAAAGGRGSQGLYNVTDDEPAPPQDVVVYAAGLLGIPPPPEEPFETADLSPMARSFYSENRRIRNSLIKVDLGVKLAYPTYREGLAALAAAHKN